MVSGRTQINKWEERNNEVRKLKGKRDRKLEGSKAIEKTLRKFLSTHKAKRQRGLLRSQMPRRRESFPLPK